MCQKAQANSAKVRETGSTWKFQIPRIDIWLLSSNCLKFAQCSFCNGVVKKMRYPLSESSISTVTSLGIVFDTCIDTMPLPLVDDSEYGRACQREGYLGPNKF